MNYKDLFEQTANTLERVGIPEAKLDARLLLEYICGTDHSTLFAHPERKISSDELERFNELLKRRMGREPLAYILGTWDFMGLSFNVNKNVLIPEQDTEILVEEALRFCEDGMRILDLCTGSGCIAISLLNYTNNTMAHGTDISKEALEVAQGNADRLGLSERIKFEQADLFPTDSSKKYDILVSNPPYIESAVIDSLAPEVKDHEPRLALDGDEDGLKFYRRIIDNTGELLLSNGYIFLEIGYDQADKVKELMENNGRFHEIEVIKDYSGNDRVIRACFY